MSQPQWDPQTRRWYFPKGQGPPPPPQAPQGGRAEPPGYRQGFSAAQSPPPPPYAGRHGNDGSMDSPTVAVRPRRTGTSAEAIRSTPSGGPAVAPTPPPAPAAAPRKRRKWPWVLGAIVLLIVIIAAVNGGGGATPAPSQAGGTAPTPAAPASAPSGDAAAGDTPAASGVVYEVTGSGKAMNITYGSDGGVSQENGERLPWTKNAPAADGVAAYALTAQNSGSGEITCRITVDGEKIAEQTSTGQYAVVSCAGSGSPFG